MKKTILLLFLSIVCMQSLQAATYTVNSDTQLKSIIQKLTPGDEVLIADGTYTNWAIEIPCKGTAQKPISIKAANVGKVIFTGEVSQTIFKLTGAYTLLSGFSFNNCTLIKLDGKNGLFMELKDSNNCHVSNCSFNANTVKVQFMPLLIVSGNGTNNQIDHCNFSNNVDNQDVQVKITKESCPQLTLIEYNTFKDKNKVSWKNGNGGECVQIGQDPVLLGAIVAKSIVRFNQFINCNAENEVISNKSSGNTYLKNYFKNNDGELVMRGGHDCIIDGNIFEGGTGGIRINGTGHQIVNNKIDHIKTAIRLMYGMANGKEEIGFYIAASGCTLTNNQISNATTGILIGDSKNADWTGKFDTVRYPSRVMQDVAPSANKIADNTITKTPNPITTVN